MPGNYFFIVLTVCGKCRGFNIWIPTPVIFSVIKGGAKRCVATISLSPQGGAYTRALKREKSLSLLCSVGGEAVGYK